MTTMNRWEVQSRIDVRSTDAGKVGKSVATIISPPHPIQWLISPPNQLWIYLSVERPCLEHQWIAIPPPSVIHTI